MLGAREDQYALSPALIPEVWKGKVPKVLIANPLMAPSNRQRLNRAVKTQPMMGGTLQAGALTGGE